MKAFDLERKTRASEDASAGGGLVLARQVDHVVGEVEGNFIQRKVRELDFFREHDVAVAVIAGQRSGPVGTHGEFPDLKFLGGNSFVVRLNDRDFIEEPIRSAMLSQVLRAVGVRTLRLMACRYQFSLQVNCSKSPLLSVELVGGMHGFALHVLGED